MIQLAQQLDYFENIHSIPGIGKLHSYDYWEIGDIKRFKSNKQLNVLLALISNDINQVIHTVEIPSTSVVIKSEKTFILVIMNIIRGQHHYDNHVVDYYYN